MYIYINIYLYACIYKGLGAVSWAVMAEIMPTRPRAKAMSLFLMAAIGLKGGVQVSEAGPSGGMIAAGVAGLLLSFRGRWNTRMG